MTGMMALRLGGQFAVFGTVILLGRMLGPADFGRYSFLFGFLMILTLFNLHGLNDILVREMASRPTERDVIYRSGLALKFVAGGAAFLTACSLIVAFPVTDLPPWVGCAAALTLWFSFSMSSLRLVWDVPYQVDFRMTSASMVNFGAKVLFLLALVLWAWLGSRRGEPVEGLFVPGVITGGVAAVVILQVITEAVGTAAQGGLNLRFGYPIAPQWDAVMVRFLWREVRPLALTGALMMFYAKVNLLLIRLLMTPRDLGLYAAPMRMVEALYIVPTVFAAGMMPILARTFRTVSDEFDTQVGLGYRMMLLVSCPIAVVVSFYSGEVISLFYGAQFRGSAEVIAWFAWMAVLGFSIIFCYSVLIAAGRQRELTAICTVQAAAAVIFNSLLIFRFGLRGAVWGHLFVYFLMFPLALRFRGSRFAALNWFKSLPVPIASAVAVGLAARWLGLSLPTAVVVVPVLFLGLMVLTGWLGRGDFRRIVELAKYRSYDRNGYDDCSPTA